MQGPVSYLMSKIGDHDIKFPSFSIAFIIVGYGLDGNLIEYYEVTNS